MSYQWHDLVGNIGVLCVLGTYFLLQIGKIRATTLLFSGFNAIGAGLILVSLTFEFNMSAFLIEFAWLAISLFGLYLNFQRRSTATARETGS